MNLIIAIDAILIPFIPILFDYIQKSFSYFKGRVEKIAIRLEIFLVVSLIFSILAITFSNVFTTEFPFKLTFQFSYSIFQWLYIFNLTAAFSFLIAALFSIIIIAERAISYVDLSFLDKVKDFILSEFTYIPIYPTENVQKPDAEFLKLPLHFYDKTGLQTSINTILKPDSLPSQYKPKVNEIINNFLDKFPALAEKTLNQHLKVYTLIESKLEDEAQKQILIAGILNFLLGFNEYYYPNIYTRIKANHHLETKYNSLKAELPLNREVSQFVAFAKQMSQLKSSIEADFNNLIENQIK